MPKRKRTSYKRTPGRLSKRRRIYRVRRRRSRKLRIQRVVPKTRVVRLRYCDAGILTCTTGVIAQMTYFWNSLYDPNYTLVGHQPMGRDQLAAQYTKYCVIGAKAKVYFSSPNNATTNAESIVVGLCTDNDSNFTYSEYEHIVEEKKGAYKILTHQRNNRPLTRKWSSKKHFGYKDMKDYMGRVGADFGQVPTDKAFFHVWAQPQAGLTTTSVDITVVIDYIVYVCEPIDEPQS